MRGLEVHRVGKMQSVTSCCQRRVNPYW